nr:proteasome subunit alpha type-2-a [Quercus suber]
MSLPHEDEAHLFLVKNQSCSLYLQRGKQEGRERGSCGSLRKERKQFSMLMFQLCLKLQESPSGKLVQIEHALTAIGSGQTSLGIKAANGVVIVTEKELPSILVNEEFNVVATLFQSHPSSQCSKDTVSRIKHWNCLQEPIPVTQLLREIATVMKEFTQFGGVRPFEVSLLVAGFDDYGSQLFQMDLLLYIFM